MGREVGSIDEVDRPPTEQRMGDVQSLLRAKSVSGISTRPCYEDCGANRMERAAPQQGPEHLSVPTASSVPRNRTGGKNRVAARKRSMFCFGIAFTGEAKELCR